MRPIPEVDALDVMFPTKAMTIIPPMSEIPDEFKPSGWTAMNGKTSYHGKPGVVMAAKWLDVFGDWFYRGLKDAKWTPKAGVDTGKALAAISACIGDWSPSQEHKQAGVAFLLSEWFEDVTYKPAK